jgi:hypothetical protein
MKAARLFSKLENSNLVFADLSQDEEIESRAE